MSKKLTETTRSESESPTLQELLEKYSRTNLEPLISYANAVKGSRTEWAAGALQTIAHKAQAEVLSYKDGSVEVTVDGETLRVLARKITRRDEYQLWVAESSLAALDRLLIARRKHYYVEHGLAHEFNHDTTLHPDMAARVLALTAAAACEPNAAHGAIADDAAPDRSTPTATEASTSPRRNVVIGQASPEEEAARFKRWEELIQNQKEKMKEKPVQPPAPKPRRAKKATNQRAEAIYERDIVIEDLINILEEKLKDPRSKKTEDMSTADDFRLVINEALKHIDLPQSQDENCHISACEKPFGLVQMHELREDIDYRMRKNPRSSANLRVLMHAIDETMQQFWSERALNVRPSNSAVLGK